MKTFFYALMTGSAMLLAATTALAQTTTKTELVPWTNKPVSMTGETILWKQVDKDLGDIAQNKPVNIEFEFTNTGTSPVLITNVQASCGCTATNYAKSPVLPGETTKITATYNAAAKGAFKKTVTVTTNADVAPQTLTFHGTVL
ncbi:MAG: DUF1573 domain-containing protein [Bacteroidetes bacterium]|nr:DUF1573 domain-containing protein [Bacteroidota bacterium]